MEENAELVELIKEILRDSRELILATSENNIPWVAVLVFGHDENFNLYWISDKDTKHSLQLETNPKVAATVTKEPTGNGQDKGLQIEGEARVLRDEEILSAAREYFAKRGSPKLPKTQEEANTLAEGRSWYVLKPAKFYVIYGPLFGYDRKEYTP